jgi:hypothetical protein
MKITFLIFWVFTSALVMAKEVKDFNKVLMDGVQKDIRTDNDQSLKTKDSVMRRPASIEKEDTRLRPVIQEDNKIDKNVRQIGSQKW